MSNPNSKVNKACPDCGATDLVMETTAYWDTGAQSWEMSQDNEGIWCNNEEINCGWSGRTEQAANKNIE